MTRQDQLTEKQQIFADEYIDNGNIGTHAAKVAYPWITDKSARTMASVNMHNPKIMAYLDDKAEEAGGVIEGIMKDPENKADVRLKAATFIYEQGVGKARQRIELTGKDGNAIESINLNGLSAMELDELRKQVLNSK